MLLREIKVRANKKIESSVDNNSSEKRSATESIYLNDSQSKQPKLSAVKRTIDNLDGRPPLVTSKIDHQFISASERAADTSSDSDHEWKPDESDQTKSKKKTTNKRKKELIINQSNSISKQNLTISPSNSNSTQNTLNKRSSCWKYFETRFNANKKRDYDYCLLKLEDGSQCSEKYVHNGSTKNQNRHLKIKHNINEVNYSGAFPLKKLDETQKSMINMLISGN